MDASSNVVEIRVHGVSGTPPESMLNGPHGAQEAGDGVARFFRRSEPLGGVAPRDVEAFHWGRFTAGSPSRALWLAMVPFGLLNVSRYMLLLPRNKKMTPVGWLADATLRLLGLVLTLMLTLNVAYVSLEIVVNQCLGDPACVRDNGWLGFVAKLPFNGRLVVGTIPVFALIWLLWWFGRMPFLHRPSGQPGPWRHNTGDFGDRNFWHTSAKAPLLRAAHVAAACVLAGLVATAGLNGEVRWWAIAAGVFLLLVVAGVVFVGPNGALTPGKDDPVKIPLWLGVIRWLCLAYAVGMSISLLWTDVAVRTLPGFTAATNFLAVAAGLLLVLLACFCLVLRLSRNGRRYFARERKQFNPMWCGFAALFIASLATTLASGFSGGLAFWVADLLGKPVRAGESVTVECGCAPPAIEVSTSYWTGALLWGAFVLVLLLALACLALIIVLPWHDDGLEDQVSKDYPGEPKQPKTISKIAQQWRLAATKYRYHMPLGVLASLGGLLVVATAVNAAISLRDGEQAGWAWDRLVAGLGAWTVSAMLAGLLFLGIRSWQGQKMRTAVGVVWDLIAFWPRLAHPICPPPYGGRAVLAMTGRTRLLLGNNKKIVLSGHSQGSVVCTAVVRLLHDTELPDARMLDRVSLVTYGSQLQWAFARLFPAYMGHDEMREMYEHELATRWRSMYRRTDPLGGPVLDTFEPDHDIRLLDPVSIGGDLNATVRPELRGHSGYYLDPKFDEVVADVLSAQ